jgi:Flp pilus assembly protein TadD
LSYFNFLAGGPSGGYRLLGDSNLDWGQDLSLAARRLRERGVDRAILCYFGTASPFVEGIDWQLLPPAPREKSRDPWVVLPPEGTEWLVMSATNRQGIYYRPPGGGEPYPWLEGVEPEEVVGGTIFLYDIGEDAEVQRGLAETYRRHGLREEAINALVRLVRLRRYDADARRDLVAAYLAEGRRKDAEGVILNCPNPHPDELLKLAAIRRELGDLEGVRTVYRSGLIGFPNDPELKNAYAWFLQEMDEDLEHALELAEDAVRWEPGDPYYRDTRGMVRLKLGDPAGALADLEAALALPGGEIPEIRWHRALALEALGRGKEAEEEALSLLERTDLPAELTEEVGAWLAERSP